MCVWFGAEVEVLSDPTNITAKQFGTAFRLPSPFFSVLQQWSSYTHSLTHSLTSSVSWSPHENTKTVQSIRRTIRKVAIRNAVGEITDRKSAFSILVSDCIRSGLRKYRRTLVRVSHIHTSTRHTARPHITASATLAWLLSLLLPLGASERDTSLSTPVSST